MARPLILYSANTRLAYNISERFYGDRHFVWCAPQYDASDSNPPSSNPREIIQALGEDVMRGDRHSLRIEENRAGILRGAKSKAAAGAISSARLAEIRKVVELAGIEDFRPLLFAIPFARVARIVEEVPVEDRAHPLSIESVIGSLPRGRFDILDIYRS